jgi:hypothetical protein
MSYRLEMSKVHSFLNLRRQGWSFVRIAREQGIDRETAASRSAKGIWIFIG